MNIAALRSVNMIQNYHKWVDVPGGEKRFSGAFNERDDFCLLMALCSVSSVHHKNSPAACRQCVGINGIIY